MTRRRAILMAGKRKIVKKTVTSSSNSVTFRTSISAPIKITATFSAIQLGSGTPSPTNVRDITGWSGCVVTLNAHDYNIDWSSVVSQAYAGSILIGDDGSSVLTRTQNLYSSNSWSTRGTAGVDMYARIGGTGGHSTPLRCNITPPIRSSQFNSGENGVIQPGASEDVLYARFEGIRTAAEITALKSSFRVLRWMLNLSAVSSNLNTPIIISAIGQNQIQTNLNGGLTVEYYDYD